MKREVRTQIYTPEGPAGKTGRQLIAEHTLALYVNAAPYAIFSCLREQLPELVCGQLLADGRIRGAAALADLRFSADDRRCDVTLPETVPAGERPRPAAPAWEPAWVFAAARRFAEGTALYRETGAVHAAYLNRGAEALFTAEDISRRCAVLKALGAMSLRGYAPEDCWLFVSCRVNEEMVRTVAAAGIGLLASKSVATADAAAWAGAQGLTLLCRAWPERFELTLTPPSTTQIISDI